MKSFKEKRCKLCGELFKPTSSANNICTKTHYATCKICGKQFVWNSTADALCSSECRKELTKQNNLQKYGVEHPMQSKEVQMHHRQSMLEKHGVESPLQSSEIRQKAIKSNFAKYGSEWALGNKDFYNATRNTMIDKYGSANAMQVESIKAKALEARNKIHSTCKTRQLHQDVAEAYSRADKSIPFRSIESITDKLNSSETCKLVGDFYYDVCIESQKILIQLDTSALHSSVSDSNMHLNMSKNAEQNGYRCVHIFDWDNMDKMLELFQPKTKVNARDCKVYKLNLDCTNEFLDKYHLQGKVRGQTLCLGLVKDGQIMQVMTFGQPRYDKNYDYELLRLCSRSGVAVVGGAQRLFKFATNLYELDNIISYCDLSKFTGNVYTRLGMKLIRTTSPQEIWSKGSKKVTANLLRQRGYDQLFGTNYGKDKPNEVLMIENGWLPVYDCGQAVYEYKKGSQ